MIQTVFSLHQPEAAAAAAWDYPYLCLLLMRAPCLGSSAAANDFSPTMGVSGMTRGPEWTGVMGKGGCPEERDPLCHAVKKVTPLQWLNLRPWVFGLLHQVLASP